ncbi:hypothetical protein [Leptospirillum ferriphilum]|uniref:hypothetical protein n=1 Tax=Leptospirillum ferriphilum TaxID=178606 RepID=UPI0006B1F19A|nr:hypothetical protein [Leptospirillum ferriphilum]
MQVNDTTILDLKPRLKTALIGVIVSRLADIANDPIRFDLQKKEAAKGLGVSISAIQKAVKKLIGDRKEAETKARLDREEAYEANANPPPRGDRPVPEGVSSIDPENILEMDEPKTPGPRTVDGPVIEVSPFLGKVSWQAWEVLRAHNEKTPEFFRFGNEVIRINSDQYGVILKPQNVDRLRHVLGRLASWVKTDADGNHKAILPPEVFLRDMLADPEPPLPEIEQVSSVPVLTEGGSILTNNGYDPASRIFMQSSIHLAPIPEHPTEKEIKTAAVFIQEPLTDFPFEWEADRAHAVALFLLGFVRHAIDGPTPNHLIDAPVPGTGKSLLADVLLTPAYGSNKGIVTAANDDDEWRKRLTAQLVEGRPVINIDNVRRPLDSGTLAAALTASVWEDRRLGSTEMIRVPVRAVWVTTGNNVVMSTELARRTIRIRMDPRAESPEDRTDFKYPELLKWVRENRSELVRSALILIKAWVSAGKPHPAVHPLGSYEGWTHVIGGILEVAGILGFLENRKALFLESDFEGQAWRAFVCAWWEKFNSEPVKASDLYEVTNEIEGLPLGTGNDQARKTALGKRLGNQRNRIIGGYRIEKGGTGHKSIVLWKLVPSEKKSEKFPRGKEMTPPSPPPYPEQDGTRGFNGGGLEGMSEGPFDPLQTPSQPPPPGNGSSYRNGWDGGGGGVKSAILGKKNSPGEFLEEEDI